MATPKKTPRKSPVKAKRPTGADTSKTRTSKTVKSTEPPKNKGGRPTGKGHDWIAIERDWRTGKFTDIELGKKYGVSAWSIERRRSKDKTEGREWKQDLKDAVRHATNALVIEKAVKGAITSTTETVLAAAMSNTEVIMGHRTDIRSMRDNSFRLLRELEELPEYGRDTKDALLEIRALAAMKLEDETPEQHRKRLDALGEIQSRIRKAAYEAVDIHNRIGSAQKLGTLLKDLQNMERKAHGLDDDNGNKGAFEDLLAEALS